jgi:diguanylate cyclase (GGDEF)-like protein
MQKKPSIKETFDSWNKFSLTLLLLLAVLLLAALDRNNSFTKSAILLHQKHLVSTIASLGRENLESSQVQYHSQSNRLLVEHNKLVALQKFDYLGQYLLKYNSAYLEELKKLGTELNAFNREAKAWYQADTKNLKERNRAMQNARHAILVHIDAIVQKNIGYDKAKFDLEQWAVYAAALVAFLMFFHFSRRFRLIFKDIHSLYGVETKGQEHEIVTEEIGLVAKRMNRKPSTSDNPAMIDPITGINNYKGLLFAFSEAKIKEGTAVAVCVFEVDGFKELDRQYPKSFTQAVLKKIGFMMSLYEQHTDILARTDYSQFAMVFARNTHELALRDCEQVRRAVEEAVFKIPEGQNIHLTISGGFVQKSSAVSLEETIGMAKDVLSKGSAIEPNTIKQPKDVVLA